jgi:hypothetical protein
MFAICALNTAVEATTLGGRPEDEEEAGAAEPLEADDVAAVGPNEVPAAAGAATLALLLLLG